MPIKTKNVTEILDLGLVTLGTKVMATDPCYTMGTWCQVALDSVLPGKWHGYSLVKDEGSWGERNAILVAHHVDYPIKAWSTCWESLDGAIGVDSGQAGVFDHAAYPTGDIGDFEDPNSFYGRCCEATLSLDGAKAVPEGFVSSSGYGDGGYDLLVQRDRSGMIVAMAIIFIPFSGMWRAMSADREACPGTAA